MTGRKRSGQPLQSERARHAAVPAGTDQGPLWMIALPTFACAVVLGGYLLITIAGRLI